MNELQQTNSRLINRVKQLEAEISNTSAKLTNGTSGGESLGTKIVQEENDRLKKKLAHMEKDRHRLQKCYSILEKEKQLLHQSLQSLGKHSSPKNRQDLTVTSTVNADNPRDVFKTPMPVTSADSRRTNPPSSNPIKPSGDGLFGSSIGTGFAALEKDNVDLQRKVRSLQSLMATAEMSCSQYCSNSNENNSAIRSRENSVERGRNKSSSMDEIANRTDRLSEAKSRAVRLLATPLGGDAAREVSMSIREDFASSPSYFTAQSGIKVSLLSGTSGTQSRPTATSTPLVKPPSSSGQRPPLTTTVVPVRKENGTIPNRLDMDK